MGYGGWDAVTYDTTTRRSAFAYDADARRTAAASGGPLTVHPTLDPMGLGVRESRDSAEHPRSHAIAIFLDGTGSNIQQARIVHADVPELMGLLLRAGYVDDPQILFGVIGDYHAGDDLPLQVGQFESDNRIEGQLGNAVLEGGGGGGIEESYELALYAMARHTSFDCWEKRGEKGDLFLVGDELPYPTIARQAVAAVFGETLQADIPTAEIVAELQERFNVFVIVPGRSQHGHEPRILEGWARYVGQNVLRIEDASEIIPRIAAEIGAAAGRDDGAVLSDLKAAGVDERALATISKDLARRPRRAVAATLDGPLASSGAPSATTRL